MAFLQGVDQELRWLEWPVLAGRQAVCLPGGHLLLPQYAFDTAYPRQHAGRPLGRLLELLVQPVEPGAEPGDRRLLSRDSRPENKLDPKLGPNCDGGGSAGLLRLLLASAASVG